MERNGRADAPLGRVETAVWCRYCGTWKNGGHLRVVEPAGEPREWRLCDYCWALLEVGLQALRPGDDLAGYRCPRGPRLTSRDVYACIREGFVRGLRNGQ